MAEQCKRCGKTDNDRRTLWMACFYDMEELGLPLEQIELQDAFYAEKRGTRLDPLFGMSVPKFERQSDTRDSHRLYTMRVCKDCRADWLSAIRQWFAGRPTDPDECGGNFYARELGATRKVPPDDLMPDDPAP